MREDRAARRFGTFEPEAGDGDGEVTQAVGVCDRPGDEMGAWRQDQAEPEQWGH